MKLYRRNRYAVSGWVIISLFFLGVLLYPIKTIALTGKEIMEKQKELQQTKDEKEVIKMRLIDKKGRIKDREIVRYSMETESKLNKIMMVFTKPRDIKGTGELTWEQTERDDDQWLFLPALRKEKRISSSGKKNRFMGTDFAFEDLRPEDLTAHQYKLIGNEKIDGKDCFLIEAFPSTKKEKKESGYSKRRLWVRKDIFFTIKKEYYDRKGKIRKIEEARNPESITGSVWRSSDITMQDLKKKHKTILVIKSRAANTGLKESFFTLRKLKSLK